MFLAGHECVRASWSSGRWAASIRASRAATVSCASTDCACPAADILGEVGKGFQYAQVRLSPARLTHCMRWLGAARRAHDIAVDYARRRQAFGKRIGEHEGVGFMLADNEMDLHVARLAMLALRVGARPGRARAARIEPRQGHRVRGDVARRRSLRAGAGRAGCHRRNGRRPHLRGPARISHLRRAVGGASLEHCQANPERNALTRGAICRRTQGKS